MRYRQVHLDFHTSECIEHIGERFSKENFQRALKTGHVDSITLFSKCHHGWSYHPTEVGEMHPHLSFDLLGAEVAAAHEIGVRTPIYLSAGLDEKLARRHPDWLVRNRDESTTWAHDFTVPGYHKLCFSSPYLDYLLRQIEEVLQKYDADEIFLDIVGVTPCYCQNCVRARREAGMDSYDATAALRHAEEVYANYTRRVRETVDSVRPGLPVFHNSGHVRRGRRDLAHMNSHLELESLPTGGWGYDHFPLSAAYARVLGMDFLGMTGKFHTSWGEFGGFKHPNALRYETALAAAMGGASSVGDQMHPSGEMDMATYELIGAAYSELEACEPWLDGAVNKSDIGVFTVEAADNYYGAEFTGAGQSTGVGDSDSGCVRILLESGYLFDAIDADTDFDGYSLIIFPDSVRLDSALRDRVERYTERGGRVLFSGTSGLWRDRDEFAVNIGVRYCGVDPYRPTYLRPNFDVSPLGETSFVMYSAAHTVESTGAISAAVLEEPYFNRTVFEFSSHKHAPSRQEKASDGIFIGERGAYIAWSMFEDYAVNGSLILKLAVRHVIEQLIGDRVSMRTGLPAQGVSSLAMRGGEYIAHLLYASPVRRGHGVEVIEDILPLYGVKLSVRTDSPVKRVYLAPQGEELSFAESNGMTEVTVPEVCCSQMVVFET